MNAFRALYYKIVLCGCYEILYQSAGCADASPTLYCVATRKRTMHPLQNLIGRTRPKNLVSPPVGVALRRSGRIVSPPYIPRGGLKFVWPTEWPIGYQSSKDSVF